MQQGASILLSAVTEVSSIAAMETMFYIAAQSCGAIPLGSASLSCEGPSFGGLGKHCFSNIDDGHPGNNRSWIPGSNTKNARHFVGICFAGAKQIVGLRV